MKIGIDLDDTICSTTESIIKYANIYGVNKDINPENIFENDSIKNDFLTMYLKNIYEDAVIKKDVKEVINEIRKLDYEIYIITARSNKYIDIDMKNFILNYLSDRDIFVDDIIINAKDKAAICKDMEIDVILDDSIYNYELLTKSGVNVILYDEKKKYKDIKRRITSWVELLNYIK